MIRTRKSTSLPVHLTMMHYVHRQFSTCTCIIYMSRVYVRTCKILCIYRIKFSLVQNVTELPSRPPEAIFMVLIFMAADLSINIHIILHHMKISHYTVSSTETAAIVL